MATRIVHQGLPLIHCKCGEDILVIPDVKAMDKAIDAHLTSCSITKHSRNKKVTKNKLCGYLIGQVFDIAAEAGPKENPQFKRPLVRDDTPLYLQ